VSLRRHPANAIGKGRLAATGACIALLAVAGATARASEAPTIRVVSQPSSSRYVSLDTLATRHKAQVESDERTGVFRLRKGSRTVAIVPGLGAALLGGQVTPLSRVALVRYGRAYVPRSLESGIARLFGSTAALPPLPTPTPPTPAGPSMPYFTRICLDPGHGGKDPGACGPGYREKDIVLATSGLVASELQRRGIQAVTTRSSDVFIELSDRPLIAAKQGADAFVSIHANAIAKPAIHGIEIFYCDGKYDSAERAAAAARAGRRPQPEDVGGNPKLSAGANQAVLQMLFEQYHRESRDLAGALKTAFARAGFHVRSVRSAGFRVLRLAETPAVLVEIGFLTNRTERAKLLTDSYRRKVAAAIANGIQSYRQTLQRTRGLSN